MSLLDKAKSVKRRNKKARNNIEELSELSLAWARGEISLKQVAVALEINNPPSAYPCLAQGLRHYISSRNL